MITDQQIRDGLMSLGNSNLPNCEMAEVVERDDETLLCKVKTTDGLEINNVVFSLSTGFLLYPKVGSNVVIQRLGLVNQYFVVMNSQVDKVVAMDGALGGIPKIEPLVEVLNSFKDAFNSLLNAAKSHTHGPVPANGNTPPSTGFNGVSELQEVQQADIENEDFKQ